MKEPFKVGDRVAVYGRDWIGLDSFELFTGLVCRVLANGLLRVKTPNTTWTCDPKQCRKLVKKKPRRRVWVNIYTEGDTRFTYASKTAASRYLLNGGETVEFVEVKRKKVKG